MRLASKNRNVLECKRIVPEVPQWLMVQIVKNGANVKQANALLIVKPKDCRAACVI